MRGIAFSLSLLAVAQGRTVLVTSAGAREGRSIFAAWLASTISQNGGRALLITTTQQTQMLDQHELDQHETAPVLRGFTDILFGDATAEEVTHRDPVMEIDIIPAGSICPRKLQRDDILRLRGVLAQLKQAYSVVILDSGPLLAAQDGFLLSELADETIFLCRWQVSSPSMATASIERLRAHGANVAGIVISMTQKTLQPTATERTNQQLMAKLYGA